MSSVEAVLAAALVLLLLAVVGLAVLLRTVESRLEKVLYALHTGQQLLQDRVQKLETTRSKRRG